jgi:phage tail sheath protein FI
MGRTRILSYKHGIYIKEAATKLPALSQVEYVTVAIGTAPIHLATDPANINQPVLANNLSDFKAQLGYSDDFEKYTLCEVAKSQFELYGVTPTVFINVLDPAKHSEEVAEEYEGQTNFRIEDEIDAASIKITSGENTPPNSFTADDFNIVEETETVTDDQTGEETTITVRTLTITNTEKVVDGKINLTYRKLSTALGGDPVTEEITLTGNSFELPEDIVVESIQITSGGVNTLTEIPFEVTTDSTGASVISVTNTSGIIGDKVKLVYHKIDTTKITAEDIIGGVDAATGKATGLELVDGVFPKWNLVAGILIAPKFSLDSAVATALTKKATAISDVFPAVAIADIDTENAKTYLQAIENKNSSNLSDSHLILCYPKVLSGDKQYYLSTHLAGLMNKVDVNNDNIPYVSPSNQKLEISAAVLKDGTEVYLNRDTANILNANGIVTVFAFSGLKAWGNYTSAYPASSDPREIFIPVRRMFNFISAVLVTNYISKLDQPINRRMIEGLIHSANIYLKGLARNGALLGGRLEFSKEDNTQTNLMNGILNFRLYMTPPSPAQALIFTLEIDTNYYSSLF